MPTHLRSPIKYPGGKRKLIPEILQRLPTNLSLLNEPFFGGGSLGLQLAGEGKLRRLVAGEACEPVRALWEGLTNGKHVVEAHLRLFVDLAERKGPLEFYEHCRRELNAGGHDSFLQAALILALNKTCNNGIVRFNRSGEFNVSIGKKQDGSFHRFKPDFDHLDRCQRALRGANFQIYPTWVEALAVSLEFTQSLDPRDTWTVYADPPYTGGFVGYTPEGWTSDDDIKLFTALARAANYGSRVVLSQPDTEWARDCCSGILKGWQVDRLEVARPANSDGEGRGPVGELLIWNKPVERVTVPVQSEALMKEVARLQDAGALPTHVTPSQLADFAYGNTKIENKNMTRKVAKEAVDKLLTAASDDNCGLA